MAAGSLPWGQARHVVEWIVKNRADLMDNWNLAVTGQSPSRIEGLTNE